MIAIDLSWQEALDTDPKVIQQINFPVTLEQGENVTVFFIIEEAKKKNNLRLFTMNRESIVILFCINAVSVKIDWI